MFNTIEEIISEAKQGKMYILVDDEDRENEGDLIISAEDCTDKDINFMITHAKGLVCLAVSSENALKLKLKPMVENNKSAYKTNFSLSIEAKNGITTGISAQDRAHTIKTAVNSLDGSDIISPGHIFPLIANQEGVIKRNGHTEGSVEIAKLAGKHHSSVICEIISDDGTMMRRDDLLQYAKKHNLKISTIEKLVDYVKKNK